MKSETTDTIANDAQMIKGAIEQVLLKHGHSLEELELALAAKDTEKTAALLKAADKPPGKPAPSGDKPSGGGGGGGASPLNLAKAVGGLGIGGAGIVGGIGAGGIYLAHRGIADSQSKIERADEVKQRFDLARKEIEASRKQNKD